jgi:predicted ATP-binding protein involved in virulence
MSHNLLNSQEPNFVNVGIRKFPIENMKPDSVVLLVGKRGTGKSILMKDILYQLCKYYDQGVAMTPTQDTIDTLKEFMPESCIYDQCEPEVLEKIIKFQKKMQKKEPRRDKRIFIVFDDCMFDKKVIKHKAVRDVFMNGRHYNLFFINAVQYIMDMGPDLRNNVDYVFALRDASRSSREKLWKNFFGMFPTYDQFSEAFDACT